MSPSAESLRSLACRLVRSRTWGVAGIGGACLALALVAWLAWRWSEAGRQRVLIVHGDDAVGIELFVAGDRSRPILTRDLVRREQVVLPAGAYDLKIVGQGRPGDVLTFDLDQDAQEVSTSLEHLQYAAPFEESAFLIPVDLAGRSAFVAVAPEGLRLLESAADSPDFATSFWHRPDAGSFPARWTLDLRKPERLGLPAGFSWWHAWDWVKGARDQFDRAAHLPRVAGSQADLNGDGIPDLIVAGASQAWILAASGATGELLWFVGAGDDVTAETGVPLGDAWSTVVGTPELLDDVDGDGVVDVLATFFDRRPTASREEPPASWTEAISGATGDSLWRHDLPAKWLAPRDEAPNWPIWHSRRRSRPHFPDENDHDQRRPVVTPHAARSIAWGPERVAAIVAGSRVTLLSLTTGEAREPTFVLPELAQGELRWSDVDDDGYADLLAWMQETPPPQRRLLVAHSMRREQRLWSYAPPPLIVRQNSFGPAFSTTDELLVDLDQDGVDDWLLLGQRSSRHELLVAVNGRTGQERWQRRLPAGLDAASQTRLLVGPDIDGDRHREVYLSSQYFAGDSSRLQAFSGANGDELWRRELPHAAVEILPGAHVPWNHGAVAVTQIGWWQAGADGWPQLIVRMSLRGHASGLASSWLTCCSAGTGHVTHAGRDVDYFVTSDLDGDGVEELLTYRAAKKDVDRGEWHVTTGTAAARWRRPASGFAPIADINGDGCGDVVEERGYHDLRALDGRTGRQVWSTSFLDADDAQADDVVAAWHANARRFVRQVARIDSPGARSRRGSSSLGSSSLAGSSEPHADFDGDGVPDLLRGTDHDERSNLWLVSGRTGRVLRHVRRPQRELLREWTVDLDGDRHDEWLVLDRSSTETSLSAWSRGFSHRLWSHELPLTSRRVFLAPNTQFLEEAETDRLSAEPLFVDCNGDGVLDVVTVDALDDVSARWEWIALNGRTGDVLWRLDASLPEDQPLVARVGRGSLSVPAFDVDGQETLFLIADVKTPVDADKSTGQFVVDAIDAGSGRRRWRWRSTSDVTGPPRPGYARESVWPLRQNHSVRTLAIHDFGSGRYVHLDAAGRATVHALHGANESSGRDDVRFVAWDVDQDGDDELVACSSEGLRALRPATGEVVWEAPFPSLRTPSSLTATAHESAPRWLTFARSLTAHGSDAGRTIWSCPLSSHELTRRARASGPFVYSRTSTDYFRVLECAASGVPPHVLIQTESWATVRQATLTPSSPDLPNTTNASADPRIASDAWRGWGVDRSSPPTRPSRDERLARPLPWGVWGAWKERFQDRRFWDDVASRHPARFVRPVVRRVLLTLTLVIGPLGWLAVVVRRRRFSLRTLLFVPVLVGAVLTIGAWPAGRFERDAWFDDMFKTTLRITDRPSSAWGMSDGWRTRWSLAVRYAPPVAAVGWWMWTLSRRRWKHAAAGFGLMMFGTAVTAATLLALDLRAMPLAPDECYSWGGWPSIFWHGLVATSWCLVPLVPLYGTVKWFLRRRQPKPAASA